MSDILHLDYYYGVEAEQFSFYRVPRLIIKDERFKDLSSDAKLLYGLMLDRMSLSVKNGWFDKENRAYIIYTIENIADDLCRCKEKAVKVLAELDTVKGIGLIEKVKRGQGRPDVIYVKNFATLAGACENIEQSTDEGAANENGTEPIEVDQSETDICDRLLEVGNTDFKKSEDPTSENEQNGRILEVGKTEFKKSVEPNSEDGQNDRILEVGKTEFKKSVKPNSEDGQDNRILEVGKTEFKKSVKPNSRSLKYRPQEVGRTDLSYNNNNHNNEISYTDINHINHNQGEPVTETDVIDSIDNATAYIELIKSNIDYDVHMRNDDPRMRELYDELFEVMCEVVCVKRDTVRVAGEDYPYELVKSRYLKLKAEHLEYVIGCMQNTTTKITNIKAYMVTALYNSHSTMTHYYQQEVQHDMYGGGWEEKGVI
jgi:hypothetical protein